MKDREQIITEMCYSYRHDYGLTRNHDDPPWASGMTDLERKGLRDTMAHIFDNDIMPLMKLKGNTDE